MNIIPKTHDYCPSIYPSAESSIHSPTHLSIYLPMCIHDIYIHPNHPYIHTFIQLPTHSFIISTHSPTHPSTQPPIISPIYSSTSPSTHACIYLSSYLCTYSSIYPSIYLASYQTTHPPINIYMNDSIYIPIYQYIHPSIYPTFHPSIHSSTNYSFMHYTQSFDSGAEYTEILLNRKCHRKYDSALPYQVCSLEETIP